MSAEYIPLITTASQIAKDAIIQLISNKGIEREELSKHYKKHSEQLVNALLQWGNRINFSTSEYINGDLSFTEQIQPSSIPYLEDAMKHVKDSYEYILESYTSIEDLNRELCKQIKKIMKQGSVVPSEPSFEELILSTIERCCPRLRRRTGVSLEESTVFLAPRIFNIIFEKISYEKSQIKLYVESTSNDSINRLTDRIRVFAQGTPEDMSNLKGTLEKLILGNEVKGRINKYHEFRTQLTNNDDSDKLRETIRRIYDVIHGGKFLGGFRACDLCIPDSIPL
jgi:hypothetical protein